MASAPRPDTVPPPRPGRDRRIGRVAWRTSRSRSTEAPPDVFFTTQNLLIFPGAATQGHPAAEFHPDPDTPLVRLTTARGDRVVALFGPALTPDGRPHPNAARRPTILYFYGNGMCLKGTAYEFGHFRRLGANVLIPEYVGYGLSGGQAGEVGCRETADAAYDHLSKRPDVDPATIVAAGRSLGGAVAIDLALRRPVATLFTLSTFTRLADLARHHYPFLPAAEWLLQDWFDSLAKIGRVDCPVLFVHGRRDEIVPFAMMDRLAAAARAPVTRLAVEGAGHLDLFAFEDQILESIGRLLEPLTPGD